jgi:hypothetical protein
MTDLRAAMQVRCVHCGRRQNVLAVVAVSTGKATCFWCGKASRPMAVAEYRKAMRAWPAEDG